jgi:hypothetical protein
MSYDIYIKNTDGKTVELSLAHNLQGGTYCVGGTTEATLNVTYNYSEFLREALGPEGVRSIYGKTIMEGIQLLGQGIKKLRDEYNTKALVRSEDYWEPTVGNTVKAMTDLICLGSIAYAECPDAIWEGD